MHGYAKPRSAFPRDSSRMRHGELCARYLIKKHSAIFSTYEAEFTDILMVHKVFWKFLCSYFCRPIASAIMCVLKLPLKNPQPIYLQFMHVSSYYFY